MSSPLPRLDEWSDSELARAWTSGLLSNLPEEVWDRLAEEYASLGEEG